MTQPVIAVDFGTSNTYITKCSDDYPPQPQGIDFGDGRDGLATAILYRNGKDPIIGDKALEEFGDADQERSAYTIRAQFKPDIANSSDARKCSRDFLTNILKNNQALLQPLTSKVIFGVPSKSKQEYRNALKIIASEAGFGKIQVIDEPIGAIYFHINNKDITLTEAAKGALVVDFGGGTCDFALVVKGEVKHSWGDMHLGGRLFDDVFYQWFLEQCPDAIEDMQKDRAEFFTLWYICRKVKEQFSQAMVNTKCTGTFRKKIDFGRITDITWDKFLERIRQYSPSNTFIQYLQAANPEALDKFFKLSQNNSINLLDWFQKTLHDGLQDENTRHHPIACIIFTGGSSSWPFVEDIVKKEMASIGINPRFARSARPYATISQGLSIIPAIQSKHKDIQTKLREEIHDFTREKLTPLVSNITQEAAKHIAEKVAVSLFDQRIERILVDFQQNGGTVSTLKRQITQQSEAFKPQIPTIVEQEIRSVFDTLAANIGGLMTEWFKKHDLIFQHNNTRLKDSNTETNINIPVDIYGNIEAIIGLISIGIITILFGAIGGSTEMVLIVSGPIGWAIGLILGAIVGGLAVVGGIETAKQSAEDWSIPTWVVSRVLTNSRIMTIRSDIKKQVNEQTLKQLNNVKQQLEQHIRQYVDREIEMLSAIDRI